MIFPMKIPWFPPETRETRPRQCQGHGATGGLQPTAGGGDRPGAGQCRRSRGGAWRIVAAGGIDHGCVMSTDDGNTMQQLPVYNHCHRFLRSLKWCWIIFPSLLILTLWWTNILLWKITMLLMGKSTISMAIFNCYVSSPEGNVNPDETKPWFMKIRVVLLQ